MWRNASCLRIELDNTSTVPTKGSVGIVDLLELWSVDNQNQGHRLAGEKL